MIGTIYYIDKTVGERLAQKPLTEQERLFFQDLISGYQHGHCYLCGDHRSLEALIKQISDYRLVMEKYSEHGSAMGLVTRVFVLTFQEDRSDAPAFLTPTGKCHFIDLSTAISNDWGLGQKCCLLGENLEDCDFFQLIGKALCKSHIYLAFDPEPGGGDTLCTVLENAVLVKKRVTLAFVDSDQKYGRTHAYPNSPGIGGTARKARNSSKKLRDIKEAPPHELCQLDVHEIENLIPVVILEKLLPELPSMKRGLDRIKQLQTFKDGEPMLYYDYKEGFLHIKSNPARTYWTEVLTALGGAVEEMPPEQKPKERDAACNSLFFPPLSGNKLLHRASEQMNEITREDIDPCLLPYWEKISAAVQTWGFAARPRYG